jgi:predicted metal-dependent peptidase
MTNRGAIVKKTPKEIVIDGARQLMRRKQFYYNLLTQFVITEKKGVGTMGVCYLDKKMHLIYDPDFVSRYEPLEIAPILEHECNHFLYDHCSDFKDSGTKSVFESEDEVKDHIRQQAMKKHDHHLQNIAMDRSINVYLDDLPNIRIERAQMLSGDKDKDEKAQGKIIRVFEKHAEDPTKDIVETSGITVESFKQLLIDSQYQGDVNKIEQFEGWRYYYDLLKSCPKIKEEAQKIQTMDVHFVPGTTGEGGESFDIDGNPQDGQGDQQGQGQGQGKEQGREQKELSPKGSGGGEGDKKKEVTETPGEGPSKQQIGRMAFDALRKSNQSKLPGHLRGMMERIAQMYDSEPLPWYVILRKLINTSIKTVMENNVNIRNRRNTSPMILPGYINKPLIDIGVVWDVSGSCMDNETQGHFVNECNALVKAGARLTVYYTDTDVEHVQKVHRKLVPEKYEIRGNGGTALDTGVKRAIEDGNHVIIQLTDGYYSFTMTKADLKGRKVITVTTGDLAPKHYGPSIEINPRNKE